MSFNLVLFKDNITFFGKFLKNPKSIGAVIPSSRNLGKTMTEVVESLEPLRILEVGPGTGRITENICGYNPVLIEVECRFCKILNKKFPDLIIINGCGLDAIKEQTERFGLIVSIPLINNPLKRKFLGAIADAYEAGLLKWCVTYTYGSNNPLRGIKFRQSEKIQTVYKNIPPAKIWKYS